MPHNPDHCTPLKYQYVFNVTLACEDIEHFEEHKVMLAGLNISKLRKYKAPSRKAPFIAKTC